jgi:hypothetical protein
MTNAPNGEGVAADQDGHDDGSCADCDPGLLDHLKCDAQGIKAQADYNTAHLAELDDARTKYDNARHAYSEARRAAHPVVEDTAKQIEQILEQLRCLVDKPHAIDLLDEAFEIVEERLHECYPWDGCPFDDDCDFNEARRCEPDGIAATIADIERRTQAAKAVFTTLIGEPARIGADLTKLQADVAAIKTGMASDSRTVDFKALYADARVARYHLVTLYHGFAHVNAYVDCLCSTLTCQMKGHAAIAHLMGKQAVHQCHKAAEAAKCALLRDKTADEVMAEYQRLLDRKRRPDEDPDRDRDGDRDGDRGGDRDEDRDRDRERDSGRGRDSGRDRGRSW